jgi:hypothetical protein
MSTNIKIHNIFSVAAKTLERLVVSIKRSGLNKKVKVINGALNAKQLYLPILVDSSHGQAKRSIIEVAPAWLAICIPGIAPIFSIPTSTKFNERSDPCDVVVRYPANNPIRTEVINKYVSLFLNLNIE